ncbi:MAG: hypothetical protein H7Z19_12875 [Chitinophagaceae bacterium]|nr:hypothetical protein [Rubrivivax sp.]
MSANDAAAASGGPVGKGSAASSITQITLERDCSGCAAGSVLVLRRDGSATHTITGKARLGTQTQTSTGTVRSADFEALARLATGQGFFELNDSYEDPQIQDGPWAMTSIARGDADKKVFRRDDAAPPALRAIESAIEALQTQIKFVPGSR